MPAAAAAPAGDTDAMHESAAERRRDPVRRLAIDVAVSLAELNAGWGYYDLALDNLNAADQLAGGALGRRFERRRRSWRAEAAARAST